jgi:hypothetical protein
MAKRKYTKNSDYWKKFNQSSQSLGVAKTSGADSYMPELIGEPLFVAEGSSAASSTRSHYSRNSITHDKVTEKYANIESGILPYNYDKDGVSVKGAIELCQKAYFNISIFRSTIDLMSEFANSDIYLYEGASNASEFVEAWLNVIDIENLKDQFFREYFRSGNFFPYALTGKIKNGKSAKVLEDIVLKDTIEQKDIPIRYLVLNPADIATEGSIAFNEVGYYKALTAFELERLKNPQTDREKAMLASLDDVAREQIKNGAGTANSVQIKLDPHRLHPVFYKKQDYEPMAIPVGFSVLDDINKKAELKKVDQMIARSIENVILLVTMGTEEAKGGINYNHISAMQEIFRNQSVGRVLVADWTTKADFVIPDLRKVMGKEKYEVLNSDILDGLQNILLGDSKYADIQFKLKVFMRRLQWAQQAFLNEFLQPEIKKVCETMGFRNPPQAKFKKNDALDDADLQKLVTRLMELGVLTPEQGIKTINTGTFPKSDDLEHEQEEFLEDRKKGFYTPLVNSVNLNEDLQKIEQEAKNKVANNGQTPSKTATTTSGPSGGRPMGGSNANYSRKSIIEISQEIANLGAQAEAKFSLKYNGGEILDDKKKEIVAQICENIVVSSNKGEWNSKLEEVLDDLNKLADMQAKTEVLDIGSEHQLTEFSAAILWHSKE